MKSVNKVFVWTVLFSLLLLADGFSTNAMACDYYASPNGAGNGSSPSSPFKISNFWSVAGPGKTLCLLDGVYTGSSSMIKPRENLNGTASARITIKALNDGAVRINGEGLYSPVSLKNNDYFILEGFNVYNSSGIVVVLATGADHNIVRRVVAWDGGATEGGPFFCGSSSSGNTGNLLEDVAGFGRGRKIIDNSQNCNNFTVRRSWGRWEFSTKVGPKATFSNGYNSINSIYENVIGTWDETLMGATEINQPVAILRFGPTSRGGTLCQNNKYLGSIAYIRAVDKAKKMQGLVTSSDDNHCITHKDIVAYVEPGTHSNLRPFVLLDDPGGVDKLLTNSTEIGGAVSTVQRQWKINNRIHVPSVAAAPNIWNGSDSQGARVCKRYINGKLTNGPLWPWPMNQRIIDATRAAGKTPVDVTRTMEEIFGPIPSECRSGSGTIAFEPSSVPTSPANLQAQ